MPRLSSGRPLFQNAIAHCFFRPCLGLFAQRLPKQCDGCKADLSLAKNAKLMQRIGVLRTVRVGRIGSFFYNYFFVLLSNPSRCFCCLLWHDGLCRCHFLHVRPSTPSPMPRGTRACVALKAQLDALPSQAIWV